MDPIIRLVRSIMNNNREMLHKILAKLKITISSEEEQLIGKDLLRCVMMKWINLADALLEMTVAKLPSPVKA